MNTLSRFNDANPLEVTAHPSFESKQLRNHPLMSYHGIPNWPPAWTWINGEEIRHLKGELGVLREAHPSRQRLCDRVLLTMGHERDWYIGCLLFDNYFFCRRIARLLEDCRGRSIENIGSLEISF